MYTQRALPGYECVRHYETVSSTMDVARELLATTPELHAEWKGLVTAEYQTAGRGRQGRSWLSGESSFMGTFVFGTSQQVADLAGYSLSVGGALAAAFSARGTHFRVKWPNDLVVVVDGGLRKLGGILIEVEEIRDVRYILVGLGLNLVAPPDVLHHSAIALNELGGSSFSSSKVAEIVADALLHAHQRFTTGGGFKPMRAEWEEYSCFTIGRTELTLEVGSEAVMGVYSGVSDTGALRLKAGGHERIVHSGHIVSVGL